MTLTQTTDPAEMMAEIKRDLAGTMSQIDLGEEEIDAAMKRHPEQADDLYHSFCLLNPTSPLMDTLALYRSHCRELLERIAGGADTRAGTDAEICCVCSEASQLAPMNTTGAGVYARAFAAVFPAEHAEIWADQATHYEALRGSEIDDETARLRRKLSLPGRTLKADPPQCSGMHWAVETNCRFAKPEETT